MRGKRSMHAAMMIIYGGNRNGQLKQMRKKNKKFGKQTIKFRFHVQSPQSIASNAENFHIMPLK